MILTLYWSGRALSLPDGCFWAYGKRWGTLVNYGETWRVRESPEQIEAMEEAMDKEAADGKRS